MKDLEKSYEYIVNISSDFITLINRDYCYEVVNESYLKNIERSRKEVQGKHVKDVWGEELFDSTIKKYLDDCLKGEEVHYVERFVFGSTIKYMHVSYYPYFDNGEITHALVFSHDITRLGEIESRLINYEFRDPLTGLFNGRSLNIILDMELEKACRLENTAMGALLFISITNLQEIQLNHSHSLGNMLLENTGLRIRELLRDSDYVFRYESNELVILLSCLNKEYGPAVVARKISDAITIPYRNGTHDISLSCHVGISLFPKDGRTTEDIISCASEALRCSIQENEPYIMYNRSIHNKAVKRLQLESDMIRAFERDQFKLNYQPIVNQDGVIQGCETLIRWDHPERGLISPADFIPLSEENGLIASIGKWVIFQTIKNMKEWSNYPIYTSINLTAREFEDENLLSILKSAMKKEKMKSNKGIRLECTESMEMIKPELTIEKMQSLHQEGFEIFLDDFGTGYSSLGYLKDLPATTLKLDKSFIDEITRSDESRNFLRLIVFLAKSLNKKLIVEGVETKEQMKILIEEECSLFQGFYFSGPVSPVEFKTMLDLHEVLPVTDFSVE